MSLYQEIIELSKPYLGIATEKFLERQCTHINCVADQLSKDRIEEFAKWVEISGALVMGKDKAAELKGKVLKLGA